MNAEFRIENEELNARPSINSAFVLLACSFCSEGAARRRSLRFISEAGRRRGRRSSIWPRLHNGVIPSEVEGSPSDGAILVLRQGIPRPSSRLGMTPGGGLVWKVMRKNRHVMRGLKRGGFCGGWLDEFRMQNSE